MIDIHSHILPGVDDGSKSLPESLELIRQAEEAGIKILFATPHLYDYRLAESTFSSCTETFNQLKASLSNRNTSLQLQLGFEIFLHPELAHLEKLERFTLGQKGEYLLVELALGQIPAYVEKSCFDLILNGYKPILAHPERYLVSSSQLAILERLFTRGVKLQIEAASIMGYNGPNFKRACQLLLEKDLVSFVASDAHNLKRGLLPLREAFHLIEKQYGKEKALKLFQSNQEEILLSQGAQPHLKFNQA